MDLSMNTNTIFLIVSIILLIVALVSIKRINKANKKREDEMSKLRNEVFFSPELESKYGVNSTFMHNMNKNKDGKSSPIDKESKQIINMENLTNEENVYLEPQKKNHNTRDTGHANSNLMLNNNVFAESRSDSNTTVNHDCDTPSASSSYSNSSSSSSSSSSDSSSSSSSDSGGGGCD